MSADVFQEKAFERLSDMFGAELVEREYSIDMGATDMFKDAAYLPRLDLAMGPFNVTPDRHENTSRIRQAAQHPFIQRLIEAVLEQNGAFDENKNPRCLLSIEIEFSGSSKLIMGDFTNAGMMGHVGLVIGPEDGNMMKRIRSVQNYISTLRHLEKADPTLFTNVACLDERQFWEILESSSKQA